MKKLLGIFLLLVAVCVFTALMNDNFLGSYNVENVIKRSSMYAILGIGAAFVIITSGIDLSIGSTVGLVGTLLPWLLVRQGWAVPLALGAGMSVAVVIGLLHGLLVTKLRLQPFIVTLCGLLIYRGLARWFTHDQEQGFGNSYEGLRWLAVGKVPFIGDYRLPVPFLIMIVIAILAAIFLNKTVWGRHMLAVGRNEDAARYSGIRTDRVILLAYVICAFLSGLGGILYAVDVNSVLPASLGTTYELYAIAAAVLGGCSLRGGEGSILGIIIGAAILTVLPNTIGVLGYPSQLEFAIIGVVILLGVMADELLRRRRKM